MATIALPLRGVVIARTSTAIPLIVGLIGTLLSWFGSGWDVSWHRLFGRDTFWSTPHLFIYVGVALWGVAALIASATAMAGRPIRGRALVVGPLRAELGLALIGVGALVTILAGPFDNLWHAVFGRDVDIWSPLHIAGAIAIDLLRARSGAWAHPLALGLAFTVAFVAAELVRVLVFAPPVPSSALGGVEPRLTALYFQYYEQTVARPWLSLWPVAAAILGGPLAAASWLTGKRIGAALADDLHSEALAHS